MDEVTFTEIKTGESLNLPIRVWDSDDKKYTDLTGYKGYFTVKRNITDNDDDALIATEAVGSGEVINIIVSSEDTLALLDEFEDDEREITAVYDFQLKDTENQFYLSEAEEIKIVRTVTTRKS